MVPLPRIRPLPVFFIPGALENKVRRDEHTKEDLRVLCEGNLTDSGGSFVCY